MVNKELEIYSVVGCDLDYTSDDGDVCIYRLELRTHYCSVDETDDGVYSSAKTSDYTNSGFDRGHLVPAADMKMDFTSVKEAAYMSNISPQKPKFNQAIIKLHPY